MSRIVMRWPCNQIVLLFLIVFSGKLCKANLEVYVSHGLGLNGDFASRGKLERNVDLTDEFSSSLKDAIEKRLLYRIKLDDKSILTASNTCTLYKAGFKEEIALHVKKDATIIGMDYISVQGALSQSRSCSNINHLGKITIQSTLKFIEAEKAQSIPIQAFSKEVPVGLQHLLQKEKVSKESEKPPSAFDFFKRYWYIIIPAFLFISMGNSAQPAEKGTTSSNTN